MERTRDGTPSPTTQSNETVTSNVENTKEDVLRAIGPSKFTQLCMDIAPPEFWEALDVRSIPEERLKACIGGVPVKDDDVDAFHREEDYNLRFPNKSLVIKDIIYVLMMDLMKKIPGFIDAHLLQAEGYYLHALYGYPLPDEPAQTVIHSPIGNREPSLEEEENGPLSSDASDDFNKSHTPTDLTIVSSPSLVGEPTAADKRTASDNKKAEDDKKKAEDDENNAEEKQETERKRDEDKAQKQADAEKEKAEKQEKKRKRDEEKAQKQADADKEKAEKQAEKKRKKEERQADAEKEKAEKQAEKKRKRDEEKAQKQADAEKEKAEKQAEKKRKREEKEADAEKEKAQRQAEKQANKQAKKQADEEAKKEKEEARKREQEARKREQAIAKGCVPESGRRREIFDCLLQEGGEVDPKKLQKHMIENYGYLNELAVMRVLTKEKDFDKPLWTGVIESNRYTKFTFTRHGKREVKRLQKDKGEEEEAPDLEGNMDVEAKTPKTVPDPVLRFECYSLTDEGWRPSPASMNAPWYNYGVDVYCKLVPATEESPSEMIYRFNYGGGENSMWFHTHCRKMMEHLIHSNINKWGYIKDRVPASFDAASQEDWGPPREDVLRAVIQEPRR